MKATFYDYLVFRTHVLPTVAMEDQLETEQFINALYVASPDLYDALQKETKEPSEQKKLAISKYKYQSRMTNRCTPFGLFSGVGTATWSDNSGIELGDSMKACVRLDMAYVAALVNHLLSLDCVRKSISWKRNNTIRQKEGKFTYFESNYVKEKREYTLTSIERNEYIDLIYREADAGVKHEQLVTNLKELDFELNDEEIEDYLNSIYDSQFLMTDLHPTVTGMYHFEKLLESLNRLVSESRDEGLKVLCLQLMHLDQLLKKMTSVEQCTLEKYKEIEDLLSEIAIPFERWSITQTDLFATTQKATVSSEIQTQLSLAIQFLEKISGSKNSGLDELKGAISKRFGSKAVPLLDLFSEESGLTYPVNSNIEDTPLLNGLSFSEHKPKESTLNVNFADKLLTKKLQFAFKNDLFEIEFTDEDLSGFSAQASNSVPSYSVFFSHFPNNDRTVQLHNLSFYSVSNMLGRFSYGSDVIQDVMTQIAEDEQHAFPDQILADIVHLSDDRLGNVTSRLSSYDYEIPIYTAASEVKKSIELNDIHVTVVNNSIQLWSKKMGKQIIPRLTNAHNFKSNTIPIYHFLCDLQHQSSHSLQKFDWGNFAFMYKFRPRAVYKKVILKEALWNFIGEDIDALCLEFKESGNINMFAETWKLPQQFLLANGDNTLLIDQQNSISLAVLISEIKGKTEIQLTEFIQDEGNSLVLDHRGKAHRNELIAFLKNDDFVPQTSLQTPDFNQEVEQECYPGSEWLFYKIYLSTALHERFLKHHVRPLVLELKQEGLIKGFFFIKYFDTDFHLRLRFYIPDELNRSQVFDRVNAVFQKLAADSMLWNIQLDTYQRELDRYGSTTMQETESIFSIDSFYILELISTAEVNGLDLTDTHKLQYAFLTALNLIRFFCKEEQEMLNFSEQGYQAFLYEHGESKNLRHDLDKFYRHYRSDFEGLILNDTQEQTAEMELIIELATLKMQVDSPVLTLIQTKMKQTNFDKFMYISSLIHMSVNRLFTAKQRSHELLVYALLIRCLKSVSARIRKNELNTTLTLKND